MQSLLAGYALYFNHRYRRSGHLFQNRYLSKLCGKDGYLLTLVRYIHLNPLRAGLVRNLEELDFYPWSGHAVLMGNSRATWQATQEVLGWFPGSAREPRAAYRLFVAQGLEWSAPESDGSEESLLRREEGRWMWTAHDKELKGENIAGASAFVSRVLAFSGEQQDTKLRLRRLGCSELPKTP